MPEFGLFLSSEEHGPRELITQAQQGAEAGFRSIMISDHFHPWLDRQGQSPFVWSVIGGIAATTELKVTTGVTCPTTRMHPVIVAQAAATSQLLLGGGSCWEWDPGRRSTSTSSETAGRRRRPVWRCSKRQSPSCGICGPAT